MLQKRITSQQDLDTWTQSATYEELIAFIEALQELVKGKTNSECSPLTQAVAALVSILERVDAIIDANPVIKDKNVTRFGKLEFRDFYDQVAEEAAALLQPFDGIDKEYLIESWGDRTRIDYGSGHELNFICLLWSLQKLSYVSADDYTNLVLVVFTKYITIMRKLQTNYWLEPAGSHGVWGLDDYHFLPFLFGASQLATHPYIKPKLIHNDELIDMYWKEYMYFECIHFLNLIKTIPNNQEKLSLRWHSPMLDDISSAKNWDKIKQGMIKMYRAEVLLKLPIMQHFMFGSVISCPEGISETTEEAHEGHGHAHSTWGDCCGIKVPSGIAASELLKMRKVPFD